MDNDTVRLSTLTYQGHLCDFTVASGDGLFINCHSLVLGSLSPLILDLVKETGSQNLMLPDFTVTEVAELMTFVYTGQYDIVFFNNQF